MNIPCIDTNVIIRYLVENPQTINPRFKGVYGFFEKLELGTLKAYLADIVLFQAFFVLTSYYEVPTAVAAEKLQIAVQFRGIQMYDKHVATECLQILQSENIDIVDAYLLAYSRSKGITGVYSFDNDFAMRGLPLLKVE
jgi:predicted nucleic acid-binding protein